MGAFDDAWQLLKALPEQQVVDPYGHNVKTMHPAIQGMMERAGTLKPEGQRMHNDKSMHGVYPETPREGETYDEMMERLYAARRAPPGHLQGGWRSSQRPQTDMSMDEIDFPHELDEGYATREDYNQAMEDRYHYREPTVQPTVPGYAKITPEMRPFR